MDNLNVENILNDFAWIKELVEPGIEITAVVEEGTSPTGIKYPVVAVTIKSTTEENLGHMIGVQGQHLFALQHILSLMLNNKYNADRKTERIRVNLDIGDYRREKSSAVERIALSRADDARILGDEIELEPMSSYNRMVVHSALAKFDDITTESRGEGPNRHVVIIPTGEEALGNIPSEQEADEILNDEEFEEESE